MCWPCFGYEILDFQVILSLWAFHGDEVWDDICSSSNPICPNKALRKKQVQQVEYRLCYDAFTLEPCFLCHDKKNRVLCMGRGLTWFDLICCLLNGPWPRFSAKLSQVFNAVFEHIWCRRKTVSIFNFTHFTVEIEGLWTKPSIHWQLV